MKKILLLPITLPLGMARGAVEAALRTTADALLDLTGGGASAQDSEAYAPPPAPSPAPAAPPPPPPADAPVVDLDIASARPRRRPAARPARPAPESPPAPEPLATPQEVAEDLGLQEGHTEPEPDELVESEGAAAPGAEITVDEPWPGYGKMRAADVVDRLRGADPATKAIVRLFEQQHRKRRSVLDATG